MDQSPQYTYKTYLTGQLDAIAKLPMIVMLHFMGSDPDQTFDILLSEFAIPARIIAPQGPYPFEGKYSWFPEALYDDEEEQNQGQFIATMAGKLRENVTRWQQQFPTQGRPIYLGVSQGGDLCFALAAKHRAAFELCMPIAGRLLTETIDEQNDAGTICIHHGETDPIVPISSVQQAVERFSTANVAVELRTYADTGHTITAEMRAAIQHDITSILNQ